VVNRVPEGAGVAWRGRPVGSVVIEVLWSAVSSGAFGANGDGVTPAARTAACVCVFSAVAAECAPCASLASRGGGRWLERRRDRVLAELAYLERGQHHALARRGPKNRKAARAVLDRRGLAACGAVAYAVDQ